MVRIRCVAIATSGWMVQGFTFLLVWAVIGPVFSLELLGPFAELFVLFGVLIIGASGLTWIAMRVWRQAVGNRWRLALTLLEAPLSNRSLYVLDSIAVWMMMSTLIVVLMGLNAIAQCMWLGQTISVTSDQMGVTTAITTLNVPLALLLARQWYLPKPGKSLRMSLLLNPRERA